MSFAAIIPVVKMVGTAMSAYSMVKGLANGNIGQAVMGAIGAYMGVTNLAGAASGTAAGAPAVSGTAEGAKSTLTAGADVTAKVAAENAAKGMSGLADKGFQGGMNALGTNALSGPSAWSELSNVAGVAKTTGGLLENVGQGAGFFSNMRDGVGAVSDWMKDNQELVSSGMKVGGGLLQGKAEQARFDEMMAIREEERQRRQTQPNVSFLQRQRFDPTTGRFIEVA